MGSDREQESTAVARAVDRSSDDVSCEPREELLRRSRLHGALLAAMSHELRTPLNGVIGFAALLHGGAAGALSSTQREYLGDILSSARQVLQLVNDLDDLAWLDADGRGLPGPVDLRRVATEVVEARRAEAAARQIAIAADIADGAGSIVGIDRVIRRVIHHLVAAALRHVRDGARITVCCRGHDADHVRIDVEETGTGISPADAAPLLVDFDRLDARSKKLQHGVGLGLALARRLVIAQGGRVAFSSQSGTASAFSAILPRDAARDTGGNRGA